MKCRPDQSARTDRNRSRTLSAVQAAVQASGLLHRRRRLYGEVPGRLSYFLERARLDLPDAFTRYVEFRREVFQRQWLRRPDVAPRRCDVRGRPVRRSRRSAPCAGDPSRPVRRRWLPARVTDQRDGPAIRRFRRHHAIGALIDLSPAEASIHVDDVLVRDVKVLCDQGDLIRVAGRRFRMQRSCFSPSAA